MNKYNSGAVSCSKCGHSWPNVLHDGMPISCPSCGSIAGVPLEYAPYPLSLHHDRGKLFALTDLSSRPGHPSPWCDADDDDDRWDAEDLRARPGGITLTSRLLTGFVGSALMLEELHRLGGMSFAQFVAVILVAFAVAGPQLREAAIFLFRATTRYKIGSAICEGCGYRWRHVILDGQPQLCPNCQRYTLKPLVPKPNVLAADDDADSFDDSTDADPDPAPIPIPAPIPVPAPMHVRVPVPNPAPVPKRLTPTRAKHSRRLQRG